MNDCECVHIIDISNRQSDNPQNWIQTQTNRYKQAETRSSVWHQVEVKVLQGFQGLLVATCWSMCARKVRQILHVCCMPCMLHSLQHAYCGTLSLFNFCSGLWSIKVPIRCLQPASHFWFLSVWVFGEKTTFLLPPFFSVAPPQCHPQSWKELKTRLWSGKKRPAPVVPGWFLVLQCSSLQ